MTEHRTPTFRDGSPSRPLYVVGRAVLTAAEVEQLRRTVAAKARASLRDSAVGVRLALR